MIRSLWSHTFRVGDPVVFRMAKHGTRPSPRALNVTPARFGEEYYYEVEKYWMVEEIAESVLIVRTRRGKLHVVEFNNPRLRPAHWWEKLFYRSRFPTLKQSGAESPEALNPSNHSLRDQFDRSIEV